VRAGTGQRLHLGDVGEQRPGVQRRLDAGGATDEGDRAAELEPAGPPAAVAHDGVEDERAGDARVEVARQLVGEADAEVADEAEEDGVAGPDVAGLVDATVVGGGPVAEAALVGEGERAGRGRRPRPGEPADGDEEQGDEGEARQDPLVPA
jgi:hypothetical protein